ncbi:MULTISPECIES: PLDc N-terminal domain-containing protein [Pseudomonas]
MLQTLRALCRRSHKTVGIKAAWAIGLIIFPLLGLIVWGLAGG